jgi:ABC-type transport system involved in cytochrome c biogenesis permease component
LLAILTFSLLVAMVFRFSMRDFTVDIDPFAGAMIWVTILFSGMLGLGRAFSLER